jgi:hypothetical protein
MSLLPLSAGRQAGEAEVMNLLHRISEIISECNEAQRRLMSYSLSYDRYAPEPNAAPDTYAEFLLRTSAPSWREPSARQRAAGRPVR